MPSLRPILALVVVSAIAVACGSPSTASDDSGGANPSAVESVDGGGGGGGGSGANGSATYEISGDVTKSGELAFTYIDGGVSTFVDTGWVAYFYSEDQQTLIQINSVPGSNIVNFGDGEILVPGTADTGCNFDFSQNDASGLKGTIDCTNVTGINNTSGARLQVDMHVTVDAHT